MKVLVAHSDAEVRAAVAAVLVRIDADVVEAADVAAALAACREHLPDVALVDLGACGGDPQRLLEPIKSDADLFRTSVVLLCPEIEVDAMLRAHAQGAEDVLSWPATDAEVLSRVRAAGRAAALREQ